MSLLTPEPGLLFWMLLSFGITVFVLAKFGFPVIMKSVEKRNNYIEESLVAARKAHEELAGIKETGDALLAKTRKEQAEILREAAQKRDQMIEKAKEYARLESDKMIDTARRQIVAEKEDAIRAIRSEAVTLSLTLTEKILREKLGTKEEQMTMIDRLIGEIDVSNIN